MLQIVIPVLRIFDEARAREFYIDWLGFKVDWEHRFEEGMPLYMQVSKDALRLHLSEHHGDATPGSKIFVICNQLQAYCDSLVAKQYKYYRPATEKSFYNALTMGVTDPFGNHLLFNEYFEGEFAKESDKE